MGTSSSSPTTNAGTVALHRRGQSPASGRAARETGTWRRCQRRIHTSTEVSPRRTSDSRLFVQIDCATFMADRTTTTRLNKWMANGDELFVSFLEPCGQAWLSQF